MRRGREGTGACWVGRARLPRTPHVDHTTPSLHRRATGAAAAGKSAPEPPEERLVNGIGSTSYQDWVSTSAPGGAGAGAQPNQQPNGAGGQQVCVCVWGGGAWSSLVLCHALVSSWPCRASLLRVRPHTTTHVQAPAMGMNPMAMFTAMLAATQSMNLKKAMDQTSASPAPTSAPPDAKPAPQQQQQH